MRVLGIDPGTVNLGYALVESNNEDLSLIDSGVLKVSAKIEVSQRLNQIFNSLSGIIEKSGGTICFSKCSYCNVDW